MVPEKALKWGKGVCRFFRELIFTRDLHLIPSTKILCEHLFYVLLVFIHSCLLKHVAWWKVNFYTIRAHICDIHIISWGPALHDGCKEAEVCCSIISKDTCLNIHEDAKQAAGPRLTAGLLVIIILWLSNISILLLLMDCKHFNYSILLNDTV